MPPCSLKAVRLLQQQEEPTLTEIIDFRTDVSQHKELSDQDQKCRSCQERLGTVCTGLARNPLHTLQVLETLRTPVNVAWRKRAELTFAGKAQKKAPALDNDLKYIIQTGQSPPNPDEEDNEPTVMQDIGYR